MAISDEVTEHSLCMNNYLFFILELGKQGNDLGSTVSYLLKGSTKWSLFVQSLC
jgi:hypothetical protein